MKIYIQMKIQIHLKKLTSLIQMKIQFQYPKKKPEQKLIKKLK